MRQRSGLFWDAIEGRAPMPPAAHTLGFHLISSEPEHNRITVGFVATKSFTNPFGEVLGGFQAAMLYDTVGPALLATLEPGQFISTLELHATFLHPAQVGEMIGQGSVRRRVGDLATLEGTLRDRTGSIVATATATARVVTNTTRSAVRSDDQQAGRSAPESR